MKQNYNESVKDICTEFLKTKPESEVRNGKIPLIKSVREFSKSLFFREHQTIMSLKDAKELVEFLYTDEEMYPKSFKVGDKISVRDSLDDSWEDNQIFVHYNLDSPFPYSTLKVFPDGSVSTWKWKYAK